MAREVVNGGAYGVKLSEKVVRDGNRGRRVGRLDGGREMVKGKDIGSYHD